MLKNSRGGGRSGFSKRPAAAPPPIVLLTDYGSGGPYPAALRGVLLTLAPRSPVVDLSHEVPSFSIVAGMYLLKGASPFFPEGTIFVAVVDPGVGTARRAIGVRAGGRTFLAPDNGLLGFLKKEGSVRQIVELTDRRFFLPEISPTFHGRDLFAPAAAHLARGVPLARMGPRLGDFVGEGLPGAVRTRRGLRGEVIYVDPFGTLVTSVVAEDLADLRRGGREPVAFFGRRRVGRLLRTFAETGRGEPLALIGSAGHLEIAVREGSAAEFFGGKIGDAVRVGR